MEIKNYYLRDSKTFFDSIIKVLICFGIDYVLINKDDILELHFDNYIFRGHPYDKSMNNQNITCVQGQGISTFTAKQTILEISRFLQENPDTLNALDNEEFGINPEKSKNFNPLYKDAGVKNTKPKKLTKKDLKNDKNNYRVKNRYIGANTHRR